MKILWPRKKQRVLWTRPKSSTDILAEMILKHCHDSQEMNRGFWKVEDHVLWTQAEWVCPSVFREKSFFFSRENRNRKLD